jgi:hypothetical protein
LTIHHKKSGAFRVVHADGAWGGVNQFGIVHLTFYAEHPAIPTSVTYPVKDGVTINQPKAVGDDGTQREMEIDIALSLPAAVQVQKTLEIFIKMAMSQMNALSENLKQQEKQTESK